MTFLRRCISIIWDFALFKSVSVSVSRQTNRNILWCFVSPCSVLLILSSNSASLHSTAILSPLHSLKYFSMSSASQSAMCSLSNCKMIAITMRRIMRIQHHKFPDSDMIITGVLNLANFNQPFLLEVSSQRIVHDI